jgi:SH3 domain protein
MIKYLLMTVFISTLVFNAEAQDDSVDDQQANILYITDQLRLSLYERADDRSKVLQYLGSGERLEITESAGPYVFVTTEDGSKGWVKKGFLVSEVPTLALLKQEEEKTQALVLELKKVANSSQVIDQYEKDMDALSEQLKTISEARDLAQSDVEEMNQQALEKQRQADLITETRQSKAEPLLALMTMMVGYWRYIVPILFGFMLIGFIIAKRMLESRLKKKFQGVKVW